MKRILISNDTIDSRPVSPPDAMLAGKYISDKVSVSPPAGHAWRAPWGKRASRDEALTRSLRTKRRSPRAPATHASFGVNARASSGYAAIRSFGPFLIVLCQATRAKLPARARNGS